MKRFIAVLSGLLVLPAFAEVAPIYYDEVIEYSDEEVAPVEDVAAEEATAKITPIVQPSRVNPRSSSASRTASRVVPSTSGATVSSRGTTTRAASASRGATSATLARTGVASRTGATTRGVASRAATNAVATRNARSATQTTTRRATTSAPTTARASIVQTDTVNTPLYTGRVGVRSSGMRARIPTVTSAGLTSEGVAGDATTTSDMDELAQVTDFCKAQYMQCMDNFCNVLDDNQGRCSCSKNLKNYEKTELALKKATEELQDVAQQIQYIGLTGEQVETLFAQTEAELKMQSSSDNSQLRNDLDRIKNLIVDVKSGTASSTVTSGMSFDLSGLLDFSIDSTGFDLSSLFGGTTANTNSISNQRGEQLFKTATARCKAAVLTDCQAQGVDISLITNSYDLEIDKQCIVYERSLTDANEEMTQTVRNAKSVLQRARLMVAQQKNAYDMRGCINALDSCMQDDYVCGSNYENCLDPTGKYIVNGEIVLGSAPGMPGSLSNVNPGEANANLYSTWVYEDANNTKKNAWDGGNISNYILTYVPKEGAIYPANNLDKMANYLHNKIGYVDDNGKAVGMCASVLNQCQDYTYSGTGPNKKYNAGNDVIRNFLERTMIQIKSSQDELLSDYAENCMTDVASCLSQNNYNWGVTNVSSSVGNGASNIAIQACMSEILTCKSATTYPDSDTSDVYTWLNNALNLTTPDLRCLASGGTKYEQGMCTCDSSKGYKPSLDKQTCVEDDSCPNGVLVIDYTSGTPQPTCKTSGNALNLLSVIDDVCTGDINYKSRGAINSAIEISCTSSESIQDACQLGAGTVSGNACVYCPYPNTQWSGVACICNPGYADSDATMRNGCEDLIGKSSSTT